MTALSVREALDLALRCDPQRKTDNCIKLITDSSSFVETSYERIRFDFKGPQVDAPQVYAARMLCLAWTALAQCPEYGFSENPTFWKHVFAAKQAKPIHGCARFFNSQGSSGSGYYPRIELGLSEVTEGETISRVCRIFSGIEDPGATQVEREMLGGVLAQLTPHMSHVRATSACIDVTLFIRYNAMPRLPLPSVVNDKQPTIHFSGIHFNTSYNLRTQDQVQTLMAIISQDYVAIPHLYVLLWPPLPLSEILRSTVCPSPSGSSSGIRDLKVSRSGMEDAQFQLLCSVLPYTRTLESLTLYSVGKYRDSTDHDMMWLGYALFHPSSSTSSWRSLDIEIQVKNETWIQKPWQLIPHSDPDTRSSPDPYPPATLAAGTELRMAPTSSSPFTRVQSSRTEAGIVPTIQEPENGWPQVGSFEVVRTQWVEAQQRRTRFKASITSLRVVHCATIAPSEAETRAVAAFVQDVGAKLEALDIRLGCTFDDAALLQEVLAVCPMLTSLSVMHSGELWKNEDATTTSILPKLRELHLLIPSIPPPPTFTGFSDIAITTGSLRHLRALRISVWSMWAAYGLEGVSSGLAHVINAHKTLEYVHYRAQEPHRVPFARQCIDSARRLGAIGVQPEMIEQTTSRRKVILALIGVIHGLQKTKREMATFGTDVLWRIASFVKPPDQKILWIDS